MHKGCLGKELGQKKGLNSADMDCEDQFAVHEKEDSGHALCLSYRQKRCSH